MISLITLEQYLMGRDKLAPLTAEMLEDALTMVERANLLLKAFGMYRDITSGYRPEAINSKVKNAAKKSNHILCRATDFQDRDGHLDHYCMNHQQKLIEIGLWLEHPSGTPGWCHVQIRQPGSGNRVFFA